MAGAARSRWQPENRLDNGPQGTAWPSAPSPASLEAQRPQSPGFLPTHGSRHALRQVPTGRRSGKRRPTYFDLPCGGPDMTSKLHLGRRPAVERAVHVATTKRDRAAISAMQLLTPPGARALATRSPNASANFWAPCVDVTFSASTGSCTRKVPRRAVGEPGHPARVMELAGREVLGRRKQAMRRRSSTRPSSYLSMQISRPQHKGANHIGRNEPKKTNFS